MGARHSSSLHLQFLLKVLRTTHVRHDGWLG
jgi:hypothetical protein